MLKASFRSKLTEKAETLPAAIVTAIVSSIILLAVAGITAYLVDEQSQVEGAVEAQTTATNIDVSLRSDTNAASLIEPRNAMSAVYHVPSAEGPECKLITWTVDGTTLTRDLKVVTGTVAQSTGYACDKSSTVIVEDTKTFSTELVEGATFAYYNSMGRELAANEGVIVAKDPAACPFRVEPSASGCPPMEEEVADAWNSTEVTAISFAFTLNHEGHEVSRSIEQPGTSTLHKNPETAKDETVTSSEISKPAAPTVTIDRNPVVLGQSYTVSWNHVACSPDTIRSYTMYENGNPHEPTTSNTYSKTVTTQSIGTVSYSVVANCSRGSLAVSSVMSDTVTRDVVPPAPTTVNVTAAPSATQAALNSVISANTTCTYGSPRYTVQQVSPASTTSANRSSVSSYPVNSSPHTVTHDSTYRYQVNAWCFSSAGKNSSAISSAAINFSTKGTVQARFNCPVAPAQLIAPLSGVTGTVVWRNSAGTEIYRETVTNSTNIKLPTSVSITAGQNYTLWVEGLVSDMNYGTTAQDARNCLREVTDWDQATGTDSALNAFADAVNLTYVDAPPTTVTNMNGMFAGATNFNQAIGSWNVSNVTNMSNMFAEASKFNQNLGAWNVSKVTAMTKMFGYATAFNNGGSITINNWDVSNVTSMRDMFRNTGAFNQPLHNWDVSNVTDFAAMFAYAAAFNTSVNAWNMVSATNIGNMFSYTTVFNQQLNNWNVSNVTNMYGMFRDADAFNQPLTAWNTKTGKVTTMGYMFTNAVRFNQNLSGWNTTSLTTYTSYRTGSAISTTTNTYWLRKDGTPI